MKHNGQVTGAVFSKDESQILSWSTDGTVRLWAIKADLDLPASLFVLQIQALSSTSIDVNTQNIYCLPIREWQQKRQQYEQVAKEHYKNCNYPDANL